VNLQLGDQENACAEGAEIFNFSSLPANLVDEERRIYVIILPAAGRETPAVRPNAARLTH
jgi:hypothetical protein